VFDRPEVRLPPGLSIPAASDHEEHMPGSEIDELIIRHLQGRASPAESAQLRAWIRASPDHARDFYESRKLWNLMALAAPVADTASGLPDGWAESEGPPVAATASMPSPGPRDRRRLRHGAAAAGLAAALVVLGFGLARLVQPPAPMPISRFHTGTAERVTVALGDGTLIRLGPESEIRLLPGRRERRVELDGRAFFAVAPDPDRPFVVKTAMAEATVLGTRFDVNATGGQVRVLVVEGRVALGSGAQSVELGPNELSEVVIGSPPSKMRVTDTSPYLTWMGHALVFQSTPLIDAAMEIERQYAVRIEVHPAVAQRTITAEFADQSLDDVLAVVCRVAEALCSNDGVSISIGALR